MFCLIKDRSGKKDLKFEGHNFGVEEACFGFSISNSKASKTLESRIEIDERERDGIGERSWGF